MIKTTLRDTKSIILFTKKSVYKLALGFKSHKWLQHEFRSQSLAKEDVFFSKYCPTSSRILLGFKTERLFHLQDQHTHLLTAYLDTYKKTLLSQEYCPVSELIDMPYLKHYTDTVNSPLSENLLQFLATKTLPKSSSHGDFQSGNIMHNGTSLMFIDWPNFSTQSSGVFDFYQYHVDSIKGNESWIQIIECLLNKTHQLPIPDAFKTPEAIIGYALNRLHLETRQWKNLGLTHKLYKHKYKQLLDIINNHVTNN